MTPFDEIKTILDRIATTGVHTETDRTALLSALRVDGKGNVVVQIGKYNVHIERGQDIQIGDRITYEGPDAEAIRQTIRQMLEEYRLRPGIPFQVPPLPEHFVPRPEVTDALKTRLLTDKRTIPGILVVNAIHGLGGLGKSTLAAALAYDLEVQRRFNDGILWATLGQQPDLLSLLSSWIQALGDYNFRPTTIEAASTHLRTLLQDKTALLVVDDVWQPEHALPFRVGGPQCQVLLTTRRADVADEVGAELHQMDVMTPGQALDLLASRLRHPLDEPEQEEALQLAKSVGYLPLALELAAARVTRGTTWTALQLALEAEVARLEVLEGPRRRKGGARLEATFNLSLNALRTYDEKAWQAFVWLGVLPEDARIAAPMTMIVWEMDRAEAANVLELLWNDALLLPAPPILIEEQEWPAYRLHDLLYDIARHLLTKALPNGLGFELPKAHASLLERYRQHTQNGLWHTLPDDGYIHAHLTWHMQQAGEGRKIHVLLREETGEGRNAWYDTRERLGQMTGYLTDVRRAWQLAKSEYLHLEFRYALIFTSINTLASNIPPALLAVLVMRDIWKPEQGLAYARQIPNQWSRIETLMELAPHLSKSLLREALTIAWATQNDESRVQALEGLGSYLPEPLLQEALAVVRMIEAPHLKAMAIKSLAPYLPEPLLREALIITQKIEDTPWRIATLVKLVLHLPKMEQKQILQEVLITTWAIKDSAWQVATLALLIPYLPETEQKQTLQRAIAATQEIEDKNQQIWALVQLIPHLSETEQRQTLQKTLITVRMIENSTLAGQALAELIPHLPESLLWEAAEVAWAIKGAIGREQSLAKIVPRLAKLGYHQEALTAMWAIEWQIPERAEALAGLAPYLTILLLEETLVKAREMENSSLRSATVARLIPRLAELGHPKEALAMTREIEDDSWRTIALSGLIPHLPELLLQEALFLAREIRDAYWQMALLEELIPQLVEPDRFEEALVTVREIDDEFWHAETLARLIPRLAKIGHPEEALKMVHEIKSDFNRAEALTGLTLYLPEVQRDQILLEALEVARRTEGVWEQGHVFGQLIPQLAELGYFEEALTAISDIKGVGWRADALVKLGPHLPTETLLVDALAIAQEIESASESGRALVGLAPYLPEPLLREALTTAQEIKDDMWRVDVLVGLAPYLPRSLLQEALATAQKIKSNYWQVEALAGLVPYIPETGQEQILQEALKVARKIEDGSGRVTSLMKLISYSPEVIQEQVLHEALAIAQEIEDDYQRVATLVKLFPFLPKSKQQQILQKALATAKTITVGYNQPRIQALVASHLAELGYPEVALSVTREIWDEYERAQALTTLIPLMPDSMLREALETVQTIEDSRIRERPLGELASWLTNIPRVNLNSFWSETLPLLVRRTRKDLLIDLLALKPVITKTNEAEMIMNIIYAIRDVGRWWP